ncbi:N-acetylmuramoyl-L-alanine amidase [Bowmanella sp. Y26]|uniref:N-acetylmuramoyl-L-alanine amidase n=1 Tax=Bowmanella yangjiangensis TaxID=2811230 RepID=A0ABS3CQ73_9ALTE|nr:N-acetylmuramoyl-L-alanine amidase [Bowmanella yangjiangensis]MBN7819248.1 N-acetylmuramoyl-L-alanine amidase [Bowmanella yangjiangensis]MBT1065933.1 N-acetylmuramoyl-L-alanine amidase [Bowmanella yangjiangensis]
MAHKRIYFWLTLLLAFFSSLVVAQNQVDGVRIWPSPSNTRVVFDMQDAPEFTYFPLQNPTRLVIDLANTRKSLDFSKIQNDSKLIKRLRYSNAKDKNAIRVVFDLTEAVDTQIFALPPTAPYGNRLVIDIGGKSDSVSANVKRSDQSENRDIVVAIDAGHGGEDPGSIGYSGSYEKNVTLSVAKMLADRINKTPGMKAAMIRTGDYYIHPNKRADMARQRKADLFVSIHADAYTTPQPSGASVWVLSMRRANSELGRWLENSEKHSELLGGAAEVIQDTASERYLTQALLDMSMDHSISTSYEVSREVLKEMKQITKLHKSVPQAASLAVLTSPDIPSILVETGFISNKAEEKNLNWAKFREDLAEAMYVAVQRYFKRMPPDGTLWAKNKRDNRTHKVSPGESLSLLAQRYNVPVSQLKAANNLNSDMVRIGQVLTIPN